jgi:hypothetical protein
METSQTPPDKAARFWMVIALIYLLILGILLALRFGRLIDPAWQGIVGTVLVAMLAPSLIVLPFTALRTQNTWLSLLLLIPLIALIIVITP